MSTSNTSPFSVVVGLDFRDAGGYAFAQAARVARAVPGSEVHLVHVFESELNEAEGKRLRAQLRTYANEKAASLGGLVGVTVGIHLRSGDPARELAQLAYEVGAAMIVIGAHKEPHLKSWLLGSVASELLAIATCPVMVAGPKPAAPHKAPTIEPPCPDCERTRTESKRKVWWCERHSHHVGRAHAFSYQREIPLTSHDSEVIPTGIEF